MRNLKELPKFQDGLSYIYVEHCRIEQNLKAIAIFDSDGKTPIPCAGLAVLLCGPGTSITAKAIQTLAKNSCMVFWVGEEGVRFYTQGLGKTMNSKRLLHQAVVFADSNMHLEIVKNMYFMRFKEEIPSDITLQQLRGKEGARMRKIYKKFSEEYNVQWKGRNYNRKDWKSSDPINRAISSANACLYGICHSAILIAGYSPAIGFIHTGKLRSFVFDIADLYKSEITIPIAFEVVHDKCENISSEIRRRCRNRFKDMNLLKQVLPDINKILTVSLNYNKNQQTYFLQDLQVNNTFYIESETDFDNDGSNPAFIWDEKGVVAGGKNYE